MPEYTDKTVCRIVAEVLFKHGLKHVVCSPGSRNVPLVLAFDEIDDIKKYVVVDERMAAYQALGMSQNSCAPVGLVCTSGTALLNYAPAIAEAYYQGLPLIVISADRPSEWIDQDDSQTLRQFEALNNFVKKSYDLNAEDVSESNLWFANRITNDAMIMANSGRCGPVHINIRLDAPLGRTTTKVIPEQRIITKLESASELSARQITSLASYLFDKRILIVVGFNAPDNKLNRAMSSIAELPNVHLMSETISNINCRGNSNSIDSTLCTMSLNEKLELAPDVVITLGGALVSRFIKEYLRLLAKSGVTEHWSLGISHTTVDCFKSLTKRIEVNPAILLRRLAGSMLKMQSKISNMDSRVIDYSKRWESYTNAALTSHYDFLKQASWSSLVAFSTILPELPQKCNLYLANGTPIRYAQLIPGYKVHANYCNRGVSGIEGQIATACGGATVYSGLNVCIIGDTSFAHDISSLLLAAKHKNLRIIVINNGGGEIFRFISSTSELECREKYFCAPLNLPIKELSEAFGIKYHRAASQQELYRALPDFLSDSECCCLLEVVVPKDSVSMLKSYMNR